MAFSSAAQIISGFNSAQAADKAAEKSAQSSRQAIDLLERFFQKTRSDQEPFQRVGRGAIDLLGELFLGQGRETFVSNPEFARLSAEIAALPPTIQQEQFSRRENDRLGSTTILNPEVARLQQQLSVTPPQIQGETIEARPFDELFQESPDFQFRRDQGLEALDRSAASRGLLLSGAQTQRVQDFGQQLASQEFTNFSNRLFNLAGLGQTANQAIGQVGTNVTGQQAQFRQDVGSARASGVLGKAAGQNQAIQGFGSLFGNLFGAFAGGGAGAAAA